MERGLVDCHSHVVPSGDDGAQTTADAVALCESAAARGTAVLFATPHVWPHLPLTAAREQHIRETHARIAERVPLDLRLGFELTPSRALLAEDPARFRLQGTEAVLMEVPFAGPEHDLLALAARTEAAGLTPVIAHPERSEAVALRPALADELAELGPLQVNASSLLGRHGRDAERIGWDLLERGVATIVASDGHRVARPPHLDEALAAAAERLGPRARRLFDGSALGPGVRAPAASRAATRGA